ncbi:hypothetical protein BpHYR1_049547 [Brachionus plicatilis]|uniref:Uncharacterized protein n=1 Tax=Brachionus plicatilis TaxID=10195 RepID=A0A3M7SAW2_BRAPC|nr:hypothetical protein BpHYR1_049547 [Brachionus plicatilis]
MKSEESFFTPIIQISFSKPGNGCYSFSSPSNNALEQPFVHGLITLKLKIPYEYKLNQSKDVKLKNSSKKLIFKY